MSISKNSDVELRREVQVDPVATVCKYLLFSLFVITLFSVLALAAYTRIAYDDYFDLDHPPQDRYLAWFFNWVLELHLPVILDAVNGEFYRAGLETYLSVAGGIAAALGLLFLVFRYLYRQKRRLDTMAGKVTDAVPTIDPAKRGVFAGKYNKQILWSSIEDRALVIGPPGAGKTTFMLNQILRSAADKQSFIAVDIKPELADILRADLKKAGYLVAEIDPVTGNGKRYNPLTDITKEGEIFELVESLIPTPVRDAVWIKAEQAFFRLALLYLFHKHKDERQRCSLPAAYQLIAKHDTATAFLKTVARSEHQGTRFAAEKLLGQLDSSKPAQAGFGSVFETLNWLNLDETAHTLSESTFSLKRLGRSKRPIAVFLKFEETSLATMGSLLSALYGHIFNVLIKTTNKRKPVALYLDEVGNIPPIAGLTAKLNTIRSRHLPTWLYWQSSQQMQAYGEGAKNVFFGSADLQLFFRSNDIDTQETVEKLAGKITVAKHTQSSDGERVNNSVTTERVNRIEAAEVGELSPGEVICLYKGGKYRGEATPYYTDFPRHRR